MAKLSTPGHVSVCLVAVPEVAAWVLYGFYEVFSFVGPGWGYLTGWPRSPGRIVPKIVGASREPMCNATGVAITPDLTFAEAAKADIVIVVDLGIHLTKRPGVAGPRQSPGSRRSMRRALLCAPPAPAR